MPQKGDEDEPAVLTFQAKAQGPGGLGPVAMEDGFVGRVGVRRVQRSRPEGAGESLGLADGLGQAGSQSGPSGGHELAITNALFGGLAGVGKVGAEVSGRRNEADPLGAQGSAEGRGGCPPVGLALIHAEVKDASDLLDEVVAGLEVEGIGGGELPIIRIDVGDHGGKRPCQFREEPS